MNNRSLSTISEGFLYSEMDDFVSMRILPVLQNWKDNQGAVMKEPLRGDPKSDNVTYRILNVTTMGAKGEILKILETFLARRCNHFLRFEPTTREIILMIKPSSWILAMDLHHPTVIDPDHEPYQHWIPNKPQTSVGEVERETHGYSNHTQKTKKTTIGKRKTYTCLKVIFFLIAFMIIWYLFSRGYWTSPVSFMSAK